MSGAAKRAFDLALTVAALPLALPLLAAIALWVRLDSPGPALFRQQRVGRGGRPFDIFKFRTMAAGAEAIASSTRPRHSFTTLPRDILCTSDTARHLQFRFVPAAGQFFCCARLRGCIFLTRFVVRSEKSSKGNAKTHTKPTS